MKKSFFYLAAIICFATLFSFSAATVSAGNCVLPDVYSASFSNPLIINNQYSPMVPGTTFIYEPVPNDENVVNTVEVTYDTKLITLNDGTEINCIVVHDFETVDGVLEEDTLDWFAQDDEGNVWYFGEETEAYTYDEDGNLIDTSTEGSWEAGVDGALPGIVMLADPMLGECYQQEFYEDEAEDMAKVLRDDARVSIEYGEFDGCLKTKEWTPLSPGVIEHKYYAPGMGLVYIEELKEKTVRVELVDIITP